MSVCRAIRLCLLACLAALAVVPMASASPVDVVQDYFTDGQIDPGRYSTADLKGALEFVGDQGGQYDAFKDLVNAEITARLVGGHEGRPASAPVDKGPKPGTDGTTTSGQNEAPPGSVPTPPASVADGDVPLGFILLSGAAGVLVLVGGGMAAVRRFRR